MTHPSVTAVQRRALERALVDHDDARRYFALAGSLDTYRESTGEPGATPQAEPGTDDTDTSPTATNGDGVLPVALLSLALVPLLGDADSGATSPTPASTTPHPPSPLEPDPWSPTDSRTRPAVRRGALLALRWFDVSPAYVAACAGLPESALTTSSE